MKATIEFELPVEEEEHRAALDGMHWKMVCFELDQYYRSIVKHGEDAIAAEHAEKVRDKLREIMSNWNLIID